MPEFLQFPVGALLWDIWQRNRGKLTTIAVIVLVVSVMNWLTPVQMLPARNRPVPGWSIVFGIISQTSVMVVLLLALSAFGYTEFDAEKSAVGFPRRLFLIPVRTLTLLALPMTVGILGVEMTGVWMKLVMPKAENATLLGAVLLGSYFVLYQAFMWTIGGRLGPIRLVVLAVLSMVFFAASLEPTSGRPHYSEQSLIVGSAGLAFACFVLAWISIERQRSGGGEAGWLPLMVRNTKVLAAALIGSYLAYRIALYGLPHSLLLALLELGTLLATAWTVVRWAQGLLSERLPGRTKAFRSALGAQLWYEWRRGGFVLPVIVGGVLFGVLAPLAWSLRADPGVSARILGWTVLTPILLGAVVGKAFSKPEFWSSNLSMSTAVAVRPIANIDLIAVKVRVAAASAALTWLLVLLFLSLWATFWANPTLTAMIRAGIARIYGDSVLPQCMAALLVVLGFFLTWRLLVVTLWLGSSGANSIFAFTTLLYVAGPIIGLGILDGLLRSGIPIPGTIEAFLDRWSSALMLLAASAVAAKIGLAQWRLKAEAKPRVVRYLGYWFASTLALLLLTVALWQGIKQIPAPGISIFRNILFVAAFLLVPLGRLSLASTLLARNRHR